MTLSASRLASAIVSGLGQTSSTSQVTGIANNIVDFMLTAVVTNAPGTITGTAPPTGGTLAAGAGVSGVIALVPTVLETAFYSTFGTTTSQIKGMADAISAHLITGLVVFSSGNITGVCSNTPASPGVLVGAGTSGTITGLSGSVLAAAIVANIGQTMSTSQVSGLASAIVSEISGHAVAAYATGTVTATISAGGGSVLLGAGVGGTIS